MSVPTILSDPLFPTFVAAVLRKVKAEWAFMSDDDVSTFAEHHP